MTKTSQKRPLKQAQAGCMRGIISIFDFRHGRFTKRLLSDRSRVNKQVVASGCSSSQTVTISPAAENESIMDGEESEMPIPMSDVASTSVKELMEEEMFNEHGLEKLNNSGSGLERSNSNNGRKCEKIRSRSINSPDLHVAEQLMPEKCDQVRERRPLDNLDLEMIMESLKNDRDVNLEIPSDQAVTAVEEKLVAALNLLAEQKLSSSKRFGEEDLNHCCSKEFVDAVKTLSLNRGVLLKLLDDPDSKLGKLVENLEEARLEGDRLPNSPASNSPEAKPRNLKKSRNFFRRRTKSMECYPLGERDAQSHNKIVVLKPGQEGAESPQTVSRISSQHLQSPNIDAKVQTDRNTSNFSFAEIKRKLRNAMGKDRQSISSDRVNLKYNLKHQNSDKGSSADNFGWRSPNRNHFYTERFLTPHSFKKGESVGKLNDSNLYVEAKKHLSEMLKNGGENPELVNRPLTKSLGRVLSLPEYNGSPCCISPRRYGDDFFTTTPIRLSPRAIVKNDLSGLLQENSTNHPSPRKQHLLSQPGISSSNSEDRIQSLDTNDNISLRDDQEKSIEIESVPEVQYSPAVVGQIKQTNKSEAVEDENIVTGSCESTSDLIGEDIDNAQDSSQLSKDYSPCFESPLCSKNQLLSSPIEDLDYAIIKMERPSPISVLEPLFVDDIDVSPASPILKSVEQEIEPRYIHFEEQSPAHDQLICTRISLEDEESAFEYVEAVLLGSGLNWDEFLLRWISMYEILDSSYFDEVEVFSSRPRYDPKLLFDSANNALKEVCNKYFGCFSGISYLKMDIESPPKGMDLIEEIWRRVELHMFQLPEAHSLEQLVKAELERSRRWMELELDIDVIVSEMGDTIFDDLLDEIC